MDSSSQKMYVTHPISFVLNIAFYATYVAAEIRCVLSGAPLRQPHRRSGLVTLPSVGAVP